MRVGISLPQLGPQASLGFIESASIDKALVRMEQLMEISR